MLDLDREPRWLASLGLLVAAACGPTPPQTDGGAETGTSEPTTETAGPTTDPSTDPTEGPPPTCEDVVCAECGQCIDGQCVYDDSCCYYAYLVGEDSCGYEPNECDYCYQGYVCEDDVCVPPPLPPPLPLCPPPAVDTSEWNLGAAPAAFVLADLDGDLDLDLVAAQPIPGQVELAFNDGAGEFTSGATVAVMGFMAEPALAAGDLDGDMDVDIVLAPGDGAGLVVLLNDGGTLTVGATLASPNTADQVFVADLSNDGKLDVLTLNIAAPRLSSWIGDGQGMFPAEKTTTVSSLTPGATLVDVDVDGFLDLLTPSDDQRIEVLGGGANGSFGGTDSLFAGPPGVLHGAQVAELGGSPNPEVVGFGSDVGGGVVRIWSGTGPGSWSDEAAPLLATSSPLLGGQIADLDADGAPDLIAATGAASIAVLRGADGSFTCEQILEVAAPTDRDLLALADIDGVPGLEVIAGSRESAVVTVVRTK